MLVVCVYLCLDEQMLTGKKRRQVAGSSRQLFFACWHTNHDNYLIFFFLKKVAHFTLIYFGYWRLGSHRPVCDSSHPDSLQLQQGLFELFRQFVCTDTSGDGERKKNKTLPCFTLALFLLHSSITVTRHYNHANIAPQSCRKSVRLMQYGHGLYKGGFFIRH